MACYKSDTEDNHSSATELRTKVTNLTNRKMDATLNHIMKGSHSGLDHIEIPTHDWYFPLAGNELYHYTEGVFESYPANTKIPHSFHTHHTLKVILDDAVEVETILTTSGFTIGGSLSSPITWTRVTDCREIETALLQQNKRHLQQVTMELSPTSQPYFNDLLSDYGTSATVIQLLNGDVTTDLSRFPPVAATWLWQFKRTQKKQQCSSIDGMLHTNKFQQAFKVVKECTSSLPSGINYTLWKSIAHDHYLSSLMVIMLRLPFMQGIKHDRWAKCIDVML
jgi:hypothetical protein